MRVVYFAALQQIIFNTDRTVLERMFRDRSRNKTGLVILSVLASILVTYVLREIPEGRKAPPFHKKPAWKCGVNLAARNSSCEPFDELSARIGSSARRLRQCAMTPLGAI